MNVPAALPLCRCGHDYDVHQHYRAGEDCALCGRDVCPDFRRPPRLRPRVAQAHAALRRVWRPRPV